MKTPASLLERVRTSADPEAWPQFVRLYLPFVCYWGRRSGLQDADVADLSQEVFTQLFRKLPSFQYDAAKGFRSWLRAVTLNKVRELARRRGPALDSLPPDAADASLEQAWEAEHRRYLAARALQLMQTDFDPTSWRACWALVVEGRPAADVAAGLGITPGAAYAARARILRRLRSELEDLW